MDNFQQYMAAKRTAAQARGERVSRGEIGAKRIETRTVVETQEDAQGRIGVRRTFVRDHEIVSDSGPDLGGFNAGPTPVELLLTSLGGCLAHTFMIQAAARRIEISRLEVDVSATTDPRAGRPGHPDIPIHPSDLRFELRVDSDAPMDELHDVFAAAEMLCPVTAALTEPVPVVGSLIVGF